MLFVSFIIALALVSVVMSQQQGLQDNGDGLKMVEGMIKALVPDQKDFKLGSSFRKENGDLLQFGNKPFTPSPEDLAAAAAAGPTVTTAPACVGGTPTTVAAAGTIPAYTYAYSVTLTTICMQLAVNLPAVNVNYNTATMKATTSSLTLGPQFTGASCNNCFAQIGANIAVYLYCDASSLACYTYFSAGGGVSYNLDLVIQNPTMSAALTQAVLLAAQTTATTVFSADGFSVAVNPTLTVPFSGSLTSTGTLELTAAFSTTASLQTYYLPPVAPATANQIYIGFSAAVTLPTASFVTTAFVPTVVNNFLIGITPSAQWTISYGVTAANVNMVLNTPFTGNYQYNQVAATAPTASPTCTSTGLLTVAMAIQSVGVKIGGFPVNCAVPNLGAAVTATSNTGTQCLTTSVAPAPAPAPGTDATPTAAKSCFAGSETMQMESGEIKQISHAQIGDRVLVFSTEKATFAYSDIIAIPHATNEAPATFSHITTVSGNDIKMTVDHLVLAGVCGNNAELVQASSVRVGECVHTVTGEEAVVSNVQVAGKGVYTIVTNEDLVVVNNIVASPFAVNHVVANSFYNLHRAVYSVAPGFMKSSVFQAVNRFVGDLAVYFSK